MDNIQYPKWQDVGVPKSFIKIIKESNSNQLLSYFIVNRIFRFNVKPQYLYHCNHCDHRKVLTRVYEEYVTCEGCGKTGKLHITPQYRMGKDARPNINDQLCGNIIRKMFDNHVDYFGTPPDDNYFSYGWQLDIKKTRSAVNPNDNFDFGKPLKSIAQFLSGDRIESDGSVMAICKAAILTPFLWDDKFDWQLYLKKDSSQETPLTPLVYMLYKCNNDRERERIKLNFNPINLVMGNAE